MSKTTKPNKTQREAKLKKFHNDLMVAYDQLKGQADLLNMLKKPGKDK